MISREDGATIEQVLLSRYTLANQFSSANRSNDEKARILFLVILDFIIEKKWKYQSDLIGVLPTKLLERDAQSQHSINCFDVSGMFHELCQRLNIQDASLIEYYHTPLKKLGERFSDACEPLKCFDDAANFPDNEVLFDKHSVVKVGSHYYDLVFSVIYPHIHDIINKTPFGRMIHLIFANKEKYAVEYLKDYSVDPSETFQGYTILHWAIARGMRQLTSEILEKYPELALIRSSQQADPPLSFPLELIPTDDQELLDIVSVKYGATQVRSLRDRCEERERIETLFLDAVDLAINAKPGIEKLVMQGLPLTYVDSNGWTLLHNAAVFMHRGMIRFILKTEPSLANCYTNATGEESAKLPLDLIEDTTSSEFRMLASFTDIVSAMPAKLINLNNINQQNLNSQTLMHQAVNQGRVDVVRLLIKHKANPNIRDRYGKLAIDYVYDIHSEIFKLLAAVTDTVHLHHNLFNTISINMYDKSDRECIKDIICAFKLGLSPNYVDHLGMSLLHNFASDHAPVVTFLLSHGSNPNLLCNNGSKPIDLCEMDSPTYKILAPHTDTAISHHQLIVNVMTSISQDDVDEVRELLAMHRLSIDLQDHRGWTMLHRAVAFESEKSVRWLLDNKASLHLINQDNVKPLELCKSKSQEKIRAMLIAHDENTRRSNLSPKLSARSHAQIWTGQAVTSGLKSAEMVAKMTSRNT